MLKLNKIYCMDCLQGMKLLDANSIDLTVTSPPYLNLKKYGESFKGWSTYEDYIESNRQWFKELYRIIKQGGYVCWNIQENIPDPTNNTRKYFPLIFDIGKIATELGFVFERQIIWNKNNSTQLMLGSYPYPVTPIFHNKKESILVFRKLGKREYSREQRERCIVEKKRWFQIMDDIWNIAPVKASEANHDAPFPLEIPLRFIQVMTVKESIVLDPFAGSGTTALACVKMGRNFIGFEIDHDYCNVAKERIDAFKSQISMF